MWDFFTISHLDCFKMYPSVHLKVVFKSSSQCPEGTWIPCADLELCWPHAQTILLMKCNKKLFFPF